MGPEIKSLCERSHSNNVMMGLSVFKEALVCSLIAKAKCRALSGVVPEPMHLFVLGSTLALV
jgi:hypothetical protein